MQTYEAILEYPPFSLSRQEKETLLLERLVALTRHHTERCKPYADILSMLGVDPDKIQTVTNVPFLPVSLFKVRDMLSIPRENVFKTLTSSGTSGQAVSKIYLDREAAVNQQKTLIKIVKDFTGSSRMPMLVIDSASVVKDRTMFSARGAGILGFSIFGSDITYALDDDMVLQADIVSRFLKKHVGKTILVFGFTFMIWQHFYKALRENGVRLPMENTVFIHGGGWKRLIDERVSPAEFADRLREVCGTTRIHDYYGMVEQTGCVYMQCEQGHLHASLYSDVIMRRAVDFSLCDIGEPGIIQVVSMLPKSYPGHSLLTEDEGTILGEDDCPCGRKGKYFTISGRLAQAEIRGCSDTYAQGVR